MQLTYSASITYAARPLFVVFFVVVVVVGWFAVGDAGKILVIANDERTCYQLREASLTKGIYHKVLCSLVHVCN